jgi:hypothetical protein
MRQRRSAAEATRTVICADALVWLAEQTSLPCVITSLPDITELAGPPLSLTDVPAYEAWFRATVVRSAR